MKPSDIVPVSLGDRSYQIVIGSGLLKRLGELCAELPLTHRAVIVTNPVVHRLYGAVVKASLA
ncbi:MAG TPA: 3-dehydroquinate synthase, partial [Candidatus Methylomirabilis sp.]|nr:3-dehydroquinate synthase [Candidatus Methylomirabilis sp.]